MEYHDYTMGIYGKGMKGMAKAIKKIVEGAGMILDIGGHSKVRGSRSRSVRIKTAKRDYTLPASDSINANCDRIAVGWDSYNATRKVRSKS